MELRDKKKNIVLKICLIIGGILCLLLVVQGYRYLYDFRPDWYQKGDISFVKKGLIGLIIAIFISIGLCCYKKIRIFGLFIFIFFSIVAIITIGSLESNIAASKEQLAKLSEIQKRHIEELQQEMQYQEEIMTHNSNSINPVTTPRPKPISKKKPNPISQKKENVRNNSKESKDIHFYNTWMMIPNDNGISFYVPGNGISYNEGIAHISNNSISFSGKIDSGEGGIYKYVKTDDKGLLHYEGTQKNFGKTQKVEIVINPQYSQMNFNSYAGSFLVSVHHFVSDPGLREKIIAENWGNVCTVYPSVSGSTISPSSSERRYDEYDKYNDKDGKWSDKKYKQVTRANCNLCNGTGISPYPQSSAGSRSAMHNERGNKCSICGQYSYHFHDRCPSCS